MTGPIKHGKTTFAENVMAQQLGTVHYESSNVIAEVADAMHSELNNISFSETTEGLNNWLKKLPNILKTVVSVDCEYRDVAFNNKDVYENPLAYSKLYEHSRNLISEPSLANEKIHKLNKDKYRPILQWLGGYLADNVSDTIWFDELIRRSKKAEQGGAALCILSALRYPADEGVVREVGAHIVKVVRPDKGEQDKSDPTERTRDLIIPDTKMLNNGNLEQFRKVSEEFVKDFKAGKPRVLYTASL